MTTGWMPEESVRAVVDPRFGFTRISDDVLPVLRGRGVTQE